MEWAWALREDPARIDYSLENVGRWHYDAIVISVDVLEWGLRNGGDIPVGARANGMTWQIREPETVVIVLGDNQTPGHVEGLLDNLPLKIPSIIGYGDLQRCCCWQGWQPGPRS